MNKKVWIALSFGILSTALSFSSTKALAQDAATEVNVSAVFVPAHGYDDNDHIVMVVKGELPHICYTLGETKIEKKGPTLRVHQYAWLRTTGICGNGDLDPDLTSPYETEVSLGQLDAGKYKIEFLRDQETKNIGTRDFGVAAAETADIDDYPYASVSDVLSDKILLDDESIKIIIQGTLYFSCEHLQEPVRLERQNDVFVVMPIVERDRSQPCRHERTEFRYEIRLGQLKAGPYLVHVRAMSGKAVNRVLDVYRKL
ncbi:MAG: hypothetical protein HY074_08380 [Deltaproteobacteria bacterium]|nr:hypothetical protein [Deltaproteobacteria bacterium]